MNDPTEPGEMKQALERSNWVAAHHWHGGLGLDHQGVNLGDALTFEILRVFGNIAKRELEQSGKTDSAG